MGSTRQRRLERRSVSEGTAESLRRRTCSKVAKAATEAIGPFAAIWTIGQVFGIAVAPRDDHALDGPWLGSDDVGGH